MYLRLRRWAGSPSAIWVVAIVAAAALMTLTVAMTWPMRERDLAEARRNGTTIARLAEHYAERTIGVVELVIMTVARELGASPATSERRGAVDSWFADAVKELPQIEAVRMVSGGKGETLFEAVRSGDLHLGGAAEALAAHDGADAERLAVGAPFRDAGSGRWLLPMSRRVDARRGEPGNVIIVYVSLARVQSYFESISLGGGIAALMHRNGAIVARNPFDPALIGRRIPNARLFEEIRIKGPHGVYEARLSTDGVERIVSYRALDKAPLVAFIAISRSEALAEWRATLSYNLGVAMLAAFALAAVGALLARAARERVRAERIVATTLGNIDQGVFMIDAKGRLQAYNQRALALLGLPEALLRRRPLMAEVFAHQVASGEFDDLPPERVRAIVVDDPAGLVQNYERVRPNGIVLDIRTIALPDGGVVRTYTDVTAQRRALDVVAESEARYRLLAENATDMIVRFAPDLRRVYVSPASRELLGYSPEELLDQSPVDITYPDDREGFAAVLAEVASGARDRATLLNRTRRRDGTWIWCEARVRLVRDAAGAPLEIISVARDVDERMRQTDELRLAKERAEAATAELGKREQRYRDMVDLMPQKVWVARADGAAVYYNKQMTRYHGAIGADPQDRLRTHHPDDADRVKSVRAAAIAQGRAFEVESRIANTAGEYRWHRISMAPLKKPDGSIAEWVGTSLDIHDLRLAQADLEAAKAKAENASEAKSRFLATMSHEIRAPLNVVIGLTGMILDQADLAPDLRRPIELIKASGASLLTIINDVLDFSKIEAGKLEFDVEPFDLRRAVEDSVDLIRGMADEKSLRLSLEWDGALPAYATGDQMRLRQILLNLLNNAVKFTAQGEISVRVARGSGDRISFAVSDTGIGVPRDKLDLLFRDFSQVDDSASRRFSGTGLGLAICRRLAEGMGGQIGVDSEEGRGSTFRFTLPLPAADSPRLIESDAASEGPRARILLVDDVETNRTIAASILGGAGHDVCVVGDARGAIEAAQRERFDLIFMDIQMPGMDGVEATRVIRSMNGASAATPIIALTAHAYGEQIDSFMRAGMNGHVGKPVAREALLRAVRAHAGVNRDDARASAAASADGADAPTTPLRELLSLMGRDKVAALLQEFNADLADCFGNASRQELQEEAHRTVSSAGMLGFLALSEAARALEDACAAGEALEATLSEARRLKAEARAAIDSGALLAA